MTTRLRHLQAMGSRFGFGVAACLVLLAGGGPDASAAGTRLGRPSAAPLLGEYIAAGSLGNPYGYIPAQCYIETSGGTQNACLFCHTDGPARAGLGNDNPQAALGLEDDLQLDYGFVSINITVAPPSVNPWLNTLFPERLRTRVEKLGYKPETWAMDRYVAQDNWTAAYDRRPGSPLDWDGGKDGPFRLFPGLDPRDLPADRDGYVRSRLAKEGYFRNGRGWITGWRAINFMPYGIFTPLTGSVSGIYIRLPRAFMRKADGRYDLATYGANLDLLARAIQDRLRPEDARHYLGAASGIPVERGLYPIGTEFAHPLHYVDVRADGLDGASPFPGTRARRVKEIRYMVKRSAFVPDRQRTLAGGSHLYAGQGEGWVDNAAGWILAGFIEDKDGMLRPQTPSELIQCLGCHSGMPTRSHEPELLASGTGNTIDSTWAFPRQLPGKAGWGEMDYLGYRRTAGPDDPDAVPGVSTVAEPHNRAAGQGEFRLFLEHVVGLSLYGDMPPAVEAYLARAIKKRRGYGADWPALDFSSPDTLQRLQRVRLTLIREFAARGEYLAPDGSIRPVFLYPSAAAARAGSARYRQVVVSQSYGQGKDVFPETPFTLRYYRRPAEAYPHMDGTPYRLGEVITDRPVNTDPDSNTPYLAGTVPTLIDPKGDNYLADYMPLLK